MMMVIILLSLAYALLAALLLSLNLQTKWRYEIKLTVIIGVSLFYAVSFWSINHLRGWPIDARPPNPFKLHWAVVEDPDKLRGTKGRIYILGQALSSYGALIGTPRLYEIPYSPDVAQAVEEARHAIEGGRPLEARLNIYDYKEPEDEAELPDQTRRQSGVDALPDAEGEKNLRLEFRELPPPALPPK